MVVAVCLLLKFLRYVHRHASSLYCLARCDVKSWSFPALLISRSMVSVLVLQQMTLFTSLFLKPNNEKEHSSGTSTQHPLMDATRRSWGIVDEDRRPRRCCRLAFRPAAPPGSDSESCSQTGDRPRCRRRPPAAAAAVTSPCHVISQNSLVDHTPRLDGRCTARIVYSTSVDRNALTPFSSICCGFVVSCNLFPQQLTIGVTTMSRDLIDESLPKMKSVVQQTRMR